MFYFRLIFHFLFQISLLISNFTFYFIFHFLFQISHLISSFTFINRGWLETFEGYFVRDVNSILTGVMGELVRDKEKRFVWSEISFFQRWYERQTIDTKLKLKKLIANGVCLITFDVLICSNLNL